MELKKSATLVLALFVVVPCGTKGGLQEFLVDNGLHHVDIFYNSSQWRGSTLRDLFVARFPMEDVEKAHQDSFGVFMFDSAKDDIVSYLTAIMQRKIKTSLLFTFEPWDKEKISLVKKHLLDLQATALFYVAMPTPDHADITWHQMISLKSGSALSHLTFVENSSRIIETHDMHGLEIRSMVASRL